MSKSTTEIFSYLNNAPYINKWSKGKAIKNTQTKNILLVHLEDILSIKMAVTDTYFKMFVTCHRTGPTALAGAGL